MASHAVCLTARAARLHQACLRPSASGLIAQGLQIFGAQNLNTLAALTLSMWPTWFPAPSPARGLAKLHGQRPGPVRQAAQ
jgi:hypothetical protein